MVAGHRPAVAVVGTIAGFGLCGAAALLVAGGGGRGASSRALGRRLASGVAGHLSRRRRQDATACVLPRTACGDTLLLAFPRVRERVVLAGCLSSFVVDYAARQKVRGVHLKYHVLKQLPVLPPQAFRSPAPWAPEQLLCRWLSRRIVELVYTTWDLRPFARECGWHGPPFGWDGDRRLHLRCELDAAFFHDRRALRPNAARHLGR